MGHYSNYTKRAYGVLLWGRAAFHLEALRTIDSSVNPKPSVLHRLKGFAGEVKSRRFFFYCMRSGARESKMCMCASVAAMLLKVRFVLSLARALRT